MVEWDLIEVAFSNKLSISVARGWVDFFLRSFMKLMLYRKCSLLRRYNIKNFFVNFYRSITIQFWKRFGHVGLLQFNELSAIYKMNVKIGDRYVNIRNFTWTGCRYSRVQEVDYPIKGQPVREQVTTSCHDSPNNLSYLLLISEFFRWSLEGKHVPITKVNYFYQN